MVKRRTVLSVAEVEIQDNHLQDELDFEMATQLFLDEQKIRNRTKRTLEWYRENLHTLRVFLERQGLSTDPRTITSRILKRHYVLHMLETLRLSPVTVNGRIRTAKTFFKFLHYERYIASNPAESLALVRTDKTIIQAFTEEQVRQLLGAPNQKTFAGFRDFVIMCLLLETGMRVSEVSEIKMADLRWQDSGIKLLGKGRKERIVPIQSKMKSLLRKYVDARGDVQNVDHLFLSVDNRPLSKRNIQERLHDYGVEARLQGVRVSPHTFRHTFAKMYIKNGGDAFTLQAILGHSSLEMVRHYVNMFSSDIQEQHRRFSPLQGFEMR